MSSQKEQDKKKKNRQSILEAELFRIMEKSLKCILRRPAAAGAVANGS